MKKWRKKGATATDDTPGVEPAEKKGFDGKCFNKIMETGKYDTSKNKFDTVEKVHDAMTQVASTSLSRTVRQCAGNQRKGVWTRTSRSSAEVNEPSGEDRGTATATKSRPEEREALPRATTERNPTTNDDTQTNITAPEKIEAGISRVDLIEDTEDEMVGMSTAIVASRSPEGSDRQQWRKDLEQCRTTELQRMGRKLDIGEAVDDIIDEGDNVKQNLIDAIVKRKAKIRDDETAAEQNSWSTVASKRKVDTRSIGARGAQSPRRANARDDTQTKAAPREKTRKRSREDHHRRR